MSDYCHAATRKNNPPAKIAAEGTVPVVSKAQYACNAHLPPVLRLDPAGRSDALPELVDQPSVVRGVSRGGPDNATRCCTRAYAGARCGTITPGR